MAVDRSWLTGNEEEVIADARVREIYDRFIDQKQRESKDRIAVARAKRKALQNQTFSDDKLFPVSYWAERLSFSDSAIRGWIKSGDLSAELLGGKYRIGKSHIDAFLAKQRMKIG